MTVYQPDSIDVDWSNAAEVTIATAFSFVPEVGALLGALTYILWPHSQVDVWAEIRQQVEDLVDQKLDDTVYATVKGDLDGLHSVFTNDYLPALGEGDNGEISTQWDLASSDCDLYMPDFQTAGYQIQLLPLFVQAANLHLSLLRDGVLFGSQWGWTPQKVADKAAYLTQRIADYRQYAQNLYDIFHENRVLITAANAHQCQPFRGVNAFVRQMTLTVLDFVALWPYFDATQYPKPVDAYLDREIYSDPIGTCDNSGDIVLPGPARGFPTAITVWSDQFRVYAIEVSYSAGAGPGGVTQTKRMGSGDKGAASNVSLDGKQIAVVRGTSGDIIDSIGFTFGDGSGAGPFGATSLIPYTFLYAGHSLSSIHVNGVSQYYDSADSAVFGFRLDRSTQADSAAVRRLYVATPRAQTPEELASRAVTLTVDGAGLARQAAAENWDRQRQEWWAGLGKPD